MNELQINYIYDVNNKKLINKILHNCFEFYNITYTLYLYNVIGSNDITYSFRKKNYKNINICDITTNKQIKPNISNIILSSIYFKRIKKITFNIIIDNHFNIYIPHLNTSIKLINDDSNCDELTNSIILKLFQIIYNNNICISCNSSNRIDLTLFDCIESFIKLSHITELFINDNINNIINTLSNYNNIINLIKYIKHPNMKTSENHNNSNSSSDSDYSINSINLDMSNNINKNIIKIKEKIKDIREHNLNLENKIDTKIDNITFNICINIISVFITFLITYLSCCIYYCCKYTCVISNNTDTLDIYYLCSETQQYNY